MRINIIIQNQTNTLCNDKVGSLAPVIKVLDSELKDCAYNPHIGHGCFGTLAISFITLKTH